MRNSSQVTISVIDLNEAYEQKLWNYIDALETVNKELLNALKRCVEVLEHFKHTVPDPRVLQEMLDVFNETIQAAESKADGMDKKDERLS
jgi:hypothetical protein